MILLIFDELFFGFFQFFIQWTFFHLTLLIINIQQRWSMRLSDNEWKHFLDSL